MIIDREKEIIAFKPEEYWTIGGNFKKGTKKFKANFYGLKDKKVKLENNDEVKEVLGRLDGDDFKVNHVEKKERKRNAPMPYTTSSLQQEAARKLNFRTRKTMMVAQQLYEGISLGRGGAVGLITYMRTDSTRIADSAKAEAAEFIVKEYGEEYSATKFKKSKNAQGAQDAHEAIRPSSVLQNTYRIRKTIYQKIN